MGVIGKHLSHSPNRYTQNAEGTHPTLSTLGYIDTLEEVVQTSLKIPIFLITLFFDDIDPTPPSHYLLAIE